MIGQKKLSQCSQAGVPRRVERFRRETVDVRLAVRLSSALLFGGFEVTTGKSNASTVVAPGDLAHADIQRRFAEIQDENRGHVEDRSKHKRPEAPLLRAVLKTAIMSRGSPLIDGHLSPARAPEFPGSGRGRSPTVVFMFKDSHFTKSEPRKRAKSPWRRRIHKLEIRDSKSETNSKRTNGNAQNAFAPPLF
jgi:hypothetical protein